MTEMKKIDEFVAKNKILPSQCLYHTWRDVSGKTKGKIRVLVWKQDPKARVEYICPECGKYGYQEVAWQRPFSIKCEHCSAKIGVPKLKEQFKREMKKANASDN
jgi:DNA-directed RNA polymerase subunit RPC12/RpoP